MSSFELPRASDCDELRTVRARSVRPPQVKPGCGRDTHSLSSSFAPARPPVPSSLPHAAVDCVGGGGATPLHRSTCSAMSAFLIEPPQRGHSRMRDAAARRARQCADAWQTGQVDHARSVGSASSRSFARPLPLPSPARVSRPSAPLIFFFRGGLRDADARAVLPVSYTHLTLPTIYSV